MDQVRIAIVGDFDRWRHSHWATEAALFHAAARLGLAVEPRWVSTPEVATDVACLAGADGIWGAPGSPFVSLEGMLRAIERARTAGVPYLGTCAGFQHALIEFTRNVLGVRDANSAENDPGGDNIVITPIACAVPQPGRPTLAGENIVRPLPGTLLERLCGAGEVRGEFFCSLEANADFVPRWRDAGLAIAATGCDGEMRAFELPAHPFFLATLFQPQLASSFARPHPIVEGFLRAC